MLATRAVGWDCARKAGMKEEGRESERKNERMRERERREKDAASFSGANERADRSSGDALYVGG